MPTYYVKPAAQGGNNSLAGTSPATAWATVAYALSSSSGFASGDTLYIAPGVYTDTISVTMANPTVETNIIGDPTIAQFSGLTPGPVVITNYNSTLSGSGYTGNILTATTKNFLHFQNIKFAIDNNRIVLTTCTNLKFTKCSFIARHNNADIITLTSPTSTAVNLTVNKCVFVGGNQSLNITGQSVADGSTIIDSIFISPNNTSMFLNNVQVAVYNCTISGCSYGILQQPGSLTFPTTVRNCLLYDNLVDLQCVTVNNAIVENYNRLLSPTPRANVANNGTSSVVGDIGIDFFESLLWGQNNLQPYTSYASSPNANFGNTTGAPTSDIYGVTWTGANPDAGAGTYRVITSVPSNVGYVANLPVNTQASTITIAPGSTSQSIELYLGATGLTASTSGLSARYNRTRTASVSIPLVASTIAQAWTAGGFAEVDATNMPGIYRLDVPDAALAAGADDVTIVVRGASGTNGAVMTVKLSSGGLTSAQTASAVWGASPAGYVAETDFGGVINATRNVAGSTEILAQDIPSNVWDELKSNHTIPNTFGDYLDTKVSTGADTSRIQLRQGPFLIKQNAIDSVITEVNQFLSTVPNIEMVLIDSSGGSVSVAGATLVMRVRNQAGTAVVNNVTPTVAYADGGVIRWSPNMSWTALGVTTAGTYRIVVERTMSGVTTTFGPFLVQLSSG